MCASMSSWDSQLPKVTNVPGVVSEANRWQEMHPRSFLLGPTSACSDPSTIASHPGLAAITALTRMLGLRLPIPAAGVAHGTTAFGPGPLDAVYSRVRRASPVVTVGTAVRRAGPATSAGRSSPVPTSASFLRT